MKVAGMVRIQRIGLIGSQVLRAPHKGPTDAVQRLNGSRSGKRLLPGLRYSPSPSRDGLSEDWLAQAGLES